MKDRTLALSVPMSQRITQGSHRHAKQCGPALDRYQNVVHGFMSFRAKRSCGWQFISVLSAAEIPDHPSQPIADIRLQGIRYRKLLVAFTPAEKMEESFRACKDQAFVGIRRRWAYSDNGGTSNSIRKPCVRIVGNP